MYTMEITLIIIEQKTTIVCWWYMSKTIKILMLYVETTQIKISIQVFLTSAVQSNIEKCQ